MSVNGKSNHKHEAAISALLSEPTVALAAVRAGVSEASLHRWLRLPEFESAYREARRNVLGQAVARLQQGSGKAVDALIRNLECGTPSAEIRAALGMLDHAQRSVELEDLGARVEELEHLLGVLKAERDAEEKS